MGLPDRPTDNDIKVFNQKQLFVRDALPVNWLDYSEELKEASELLFLNGGSLLSVVAYSEIEFLRKFEKNKPLNKVYILLISLSLENAIKGLLIARNPDLISSGKLASPLKTHKLLDLIKRLEDFLITEDEAWLLKKCEIALPYWSRYPIPLQYSKVQEINPVGEEVRQVFLILHERLCKNIYELTKDGWDSGVGPKTLKATSSLYGDEVDSSE